MDLDGFGISTILLLILKSTGLTFRISALKITLEGVTAVIMVGVPSTAKDAKQLVDFIGRCVSWRHGIRDVGSYMVFLYWIQFFPSFFLGDPQHILYLLLGNMV